MESISIHGALAELKLTDSKIEKRIGLLDPVGVYQAGRKVNNITIQKDFESKAASDFQSINDLIDRRSRIKSAIVKANATTQVTVGNKTMLIADAINFKSAIVFKRNLITRLRYGYNGALAKVNSSNADLQAHIKKNQEAEVSKDGDTNSDILKELNDKILSVSELHLCDPLNANEKIDSILLLI